ncbi:aldo/keto reductase [Chloroflexota bacterium]
MEKVRLGGTELMVSRVGFGGIPIQRLSEKDAVEVVSRSIELGITFIDTSNVYTTSEERIGKAVAGKRDGLIIATKTTSRTAKGVRADLALSLKRLATDYIDLYQFHNVSDENTFAAILAPAGPLAVIEEARKAGIIRHIGLTSHQIDIAKKAVAMGIFETIMFPFNFVIEDTCEELLKQARQHDTGFIAMKPLAGGRLEKASLALKYILQFPDVVPIPGIERKSEIEEIIDIVNHPAPMTPEERKEMAKIKQELGAIFCRRCDYCQPCSQEIPISVVMNTKSLLKTGELNRVFSGSIGEMLVKGANCTKCGDCESRCPYGLPIMDLMEQNSVLFLAEKKKYLEQRSVR